MIIFTPNTLIKSAEVNTNFTDSTDATKQVNNYKFSAYMGSTQSTVATTWTKLNMDTKEYDPNNNYNTTTYGYTVPITGYYLMSVMVQLLSQAGAAFLVGFSKDGTTEFLRGQEIPNTTGNITLAGTHVIKLTLNDIVYPIYYSGTASKTMNNGNVVSKFSGYFLGV